MLGNKQFSSDYVVETVEKDGRQKKVATYIGVKYEYADARFAARFRAYAITLVAVMAAAFAACGIYAFKGAVYALIPYAFEALTLIMFGIFAVELIVLGNSLTEPQRKRTFGRVRMISVVHIALCVTAVVAHAIFASTAPDMFDAVGTAVFTAFSVLSGAAAACMAAVVGAVKLKTARNADAERIAAERAAAEREKARRAEEQKELMRAQSRAVNAERDRRKKNRK